MNYIHQKLYKTIEENGGWEECRVEVIETIELGNQEAIQREKDLIEAHNSDLNERMPDPARTGQTYYQRHKEVQRVKARNKYKKTKTEWKHPQKTEEEKRELALKRCEQLRKRPTELTMEKYNILEEDLNFLEEP